jgi:hypothetical protein
MLVFSGHQIAAHRIASSFFQNPRPSPKISQQQRPGLGITGTRRVDAGGADARSAVNFNLWLRMLNRSRRSSLSPADSRQENRSGETKQNTLNSHRSILGKIIPPSNGLAGVALATGGSSSALAGGFGNLDSRGGSSFWEHFRISGLV